MKKTNNKKDFRIVEAVLSVFGSLGFVGLLAICNSLPWMWKLLVGLLGFGALAFSTLYVLYLYETSSR